MRRNSLLPVPVFLLCLWLAACAQEPPAIPTLAVVAAVPTFTATPSVSLPPTTDLSAPTVTPVPTAVPATRPPTVTPTPIRPLINVSVPEANAQIVLGSDIVVRGLVQMDASHTVWVDLISENGRVLTGTQGIRSDVGWEAGLTVPIAVSGAAVLQASVRNGDELLATDEVPVNLVLDTAVTDRYLALFHPVRDETAVAGFLLFFDGRAQRPVNNAVTISVWTDECQNRVAQFTVTLSGSGYWQASLGVPRNVSGPACAIAAFGTPGEETYREAQAPILIYAPGDSEARGIRIANPPAGSSVTAGEELFLSGTALNAAERPVQVTILMENGRVVSENVTSTDLYGYWEMSVLLPFDVEGTAEVTVSAGAPGDSYYAEAKILINILPAPPPTAVP